MIRKHLCIPCSGALEPRSNHINLRETKLVVVGSGVKHLARIASRPVTWVIKIKHAGLGVLGQFRMILRYKLQAPSCKLDSWSRII